MAHARSRSPAMHTCFYEGTVRHRRWTPVFHTFRFRLFLVYVDLAEIESVFGRRGIWSTRAPAVAWFRRADHLGEKHEPLDRSVRLLVREHLGYFPEGPIRLLTHFRYCGFQMNPVSLYYCFDRHGEIVEAIVAEVNNTPWNEQHCYVLDFRGQATSRPLKARHSKEFHVSPFLGREMEYEWRLTRPGKRLVVRIQSSTSGGKLFDATVALSRTPLGARSMARLLVAYPILTLQVFLAIYWQALRLWLKGVPIVPHPRRMTKRAGRGGQADAPVDSRPPLAGAENAGPQGASS